MADPFRRLRLAPGHLANLDDARGTVVRVTRGRVWLTQHGDRTDHVLDAGDAWAIEREGRTILEALTDSLVDLSGSGAVSVFVPGEEPARESSLVNMFARMSDVWLARRRVPYF